jgi:large conductance mechanosensitive channel
MLRQRGRAERKNVRKLPKRVKKHAKSFLSEFRAFITKGNVVNLAVGVVLGAAFQSVISALVGDVVMPFVGMFTRGVDFARLFLDLTETMREVPIIRDITSTDAAQIVVTGTVLDTVEKARNAGHVVIAYGSLITAVINFLMLGLLMFPLVKGISAMGERLKREKETAQTQEPTTPPRLCPYCKSTVHTEAVRCPHCTSMLEETA